VNERRRTKKKKKMTRSAPFVCGLWLRNKTKETVRTTTCGGFCPFFLVWTEREREKKKKSSRALMTKKPVE
jgi:hypothetical protein